MTIFYDISHNTAYQRGMPEIRDIVWGLADHGPCPTCGVGRRTPIGDVRVRLGKTHARLWPDLLACGDYPLFVVSDRFLNAMRQCGVRVELGGRVDFEPPNESGLSLEDAPQYSWVDGKRCRAAKMDFPASGYVKARFCQECGILSYDIGQTYDRQHADPPPGHVFDHDESLGFELFTTDLGPTVFFCTQRIFKCAKKHGLTNVAFRPVKKEL